ncbi:MAG: hypothetical protein H2171_12215 [Opitutus sp.]|nr:hypothetical protein [Opitutus sp.]
MIYSRAHVCPMDATETPAPGLSSLIITLSGLPELRVSALRQLSQYAALELGELRGPWLPAVLSAEDAYGAFRDLEAIPGVELVEVVFVELPTAA